MDNTQPPYERPRDTSIISTALAVIALLVAGALVWASFDNEPGQRSAQNQIEQSAPPAAPAPKPQ